MGKISKSISATPAGVVILNLFSRFSSKKIPQRAYTEAEKKKPFDTIIVPGVPFIPDKWDSVMKARVLWSYHLYKKGFAKNIIYSGGAVYTPYIEAIIMAKYAAALGIPKEHIICECRAKHSTENVYYSYQLAKKSGFKSIALATDPFQSYFLRGFIRRHYKTDIYHLPIVVDLLKEYEQLDPAIDTSFAQVNSIEPDPFWKRIKGTLGLNINWGNS